MAGNTVDIEERRRLLVHPVSSDHEERDSIDPAMDGQNASPALSSLRTESHRQLRSLFQHFSCHPCNIFVKSKPAILILVWNLYIGGIYASLLNIFAVLGFLWQNEWSTKETKERFNVIIWTVVSAYALLALALLMYPLSGFLADVYCGRYKAVTVSFVVLWVAMFTCSITLVMSYFEDKTTWHIEPLKYIVALFVIVCVCMIIVGLAGYQANIIQFGLDQLFEAPNDSLGVFVHWLTWSEALGSTLILSLFIFLPCYTGQNAVIYSLASLPFVFLFLSTILLAFTCYKHSWFYSEPGQHTSNPYKTVFRVLNFARKNKYPLRRSAFTFCDDFRPSRIDFAKERFGGPFTTSQVEDVKTLFRIVLILIALGPVFVLEVPGSYYLFPNFALHIAKYDQFEDLSCRSPAEWLLVQSGSVGYVFSIILMPLYIWLVYSFLRKRVPKILNRLIFSFVVSLAGILYMLIVDMIGHGINVRNKQISENGACLFTTIYSDSAMNHTLLHMHWGVAIPPSILLNLGFLLVRSTAVEFISAQSPHSMKGLLVGVFFAIKGLFQFISAAAVVPFAIPNIWDRIHSVTNCGFGYYLFTIVVASIGLLVFSIVVRRYSYRQRDERPFDTRFAEQYYERYIGLGSSYSRGTLNADDEDPSLSSGDEETLSYENGGLVNSFVRDYGTGRRT